MKPCSVGLLASLCLSLAFGQDKQERQNVPEATMQRLLIHKVNPIPPSDIKIQGEVVFNAVISKAGEIESLQMVTGHPMLVPSAIEAAKQWKYRPYEVNGIPTAVETTIHVEFADASGAAEPSDSSSQSPVPIPHEKMGGHIVRKVPPIYPPLARQARIQGTVILRVIIDKAGSVSSTQLVSGHPMLAPAAVEAVKQWRYVPYELNGETVEVETDVQINFKLADDPPPSSVPYAPNDEPVAPSVLMGGVVSGIISSVPIKPLAGERVSEAVLRPRRIQKVDPIYPGVAVQSYIHGTVVLDVRVNSSGSVDEVARISGPPTLVPAAIEAVKQWKYSPYVKDGVAISVVSTVRLNFSLEENESSGAVSEPPAFEETGPRIALPQRIRVSAGVSSGLLVKKVAPEYPPDARAALVQGVVVLSATIDKQGNVSKLELVSGDTMLAPAAMEAVRQWKYRPYLLNGEAVEVETTIQVNFVLAR